jgi:hypothetical protein
MKKFIVLIVFVLFIAALPTRAQVAYDNSVTVHTFSGTTLTTGSFTISGTNRAASIGFQFNGSVSGITASCGGVSASAVSGADVTHSISGTRAVLYRVIAPPTGSQTCTASWTGTVSASMGVITATSVDQTTPMNNGNAVDCGFASTCALTITSTNGDLTVTLGGVSASDSAQTTDQTLRQSDFGSMDTGPGTGSTTHTWSHAASNMLNVGASFKAAGAASSGRVMVHVNP